jgi:hypothetical protein
MRQPPYFFLAAAQLTRLYAPMDGLVDLISTAGPRMTEDFTFETPKLNRLHTFLLATSSYFGEAGI